VLARQDTPGDPRLVAYLVPSQLSVVSSQLHQPNQDAATDNRQLTTDNGQLTKDLRQFLRDRLPDYMIPSAFVVLDRLPLTENGKVNRRALPAPSEAAPPSGVRYVAPQSKLEQIIAQIWQRVLGVAQVGIHDNFFDLGGHSLLMAQAHSQLRETLQYDLPLVKLLEYPTISALAGYIAHEQPGAEFLQQSQERAMRQVEGRRRQKERMQTRLKPR
jgi:hypothetical protein